MADLAYNFTVAFNPEEIKPYSGPDIHQKFPGEDDPVWCDRCKVNHRRGAPSEVEHERMIQKLAKRIADRIDADVVALVREDHGPHQ